MDRILIRLQLVALTVVSLAACGANISADKAELLNIRPSNRIPKSSPSQFVRAFERFCLDAHPLFMQEAALREAGYVPVQPRKGSQPQVFLVDDRRPAIVISNRTCSVQALSRTGQTQRLEKFIHSNFPDAIALNTSAFGRTVERAWHIATPAPAIIATERRFALDGVA